MAVNGKSWFDTAIVPVLRDCASLNCAELEFDDRDRNTKVAILTNRDGFELTESCKPMVMLFFLADSISIRADHEKETVSLFLNFNMETVGF